MTASVPTLSSGAILSKYRILSQVGRGGMGVVYLAEDVTLGRKVAIKLLQANLFADEASVRRFAAEARAVAQLFHPHIVPVNAFEASEDRLIIEMPYLEGGSLGQFMQGGRRFPEIVPYAAEILDALSVSHGKGIVHRDVKPSNVLLDESGRSLLADFGLAKVVWDHVNEDFMSIATSSVFLGTPRYAPPEAWETNRATSSWDLYSVGVMLYEGLSGRAPHEGRSVMEFLRSMHGPPPLPLLELQPNVSPPLSDLVHDLLEADPEARLQDAEEARARLTTTDEYAIMCRATRTVNGQTSVDDRYFITSSTHNDVEKIAHGVRAHWGIENGLHWVLDVVLLEDQSRIRLRHAAENMATIRKIALNTIKKNTTHKVSARAKRKLAGWENDVLKDLLMEM